jgi:hypothetical protein
MVAIMSAPGSEPHDPALDFPAYPTASYYLLPTLFVRPQCHSANMQVGDCSSTINLRPFSQ